jgi:pimeloyl-ACP methyl ester carboxylesterase
MKPRSILGLLGAMTLVLAAGAALAEQKPLSERVENGFAQNNGVKIHYVSIGKGPLVVFIHGFPDAWYSWRNQMEALSDSYKCVALDLRGYNLSDKPKGVENYDMTLLVGDVLAVIKANGADKAVIVAHDWGGAIAWQLAMNAPQAVDRLIICNLPHPRGIARELATNEEQKKNSQYARNFQKEDAHQNLPQMFVGVTTMLSRGDEKAKAVYTEAFAKGDPEAMLNYYKRNYPKEPYGEDPSPVVKVQCPVLMFHGLKDTALHHHGLNNTWEWVEKDLTIVTVPNATHWVHLDAADLVSKTMKSWLADHKESK